MTFYSNYKESSFAETNSYRVLGRSETSETGLLLPWSNSGIEFSFRGNRAEIRFADYAGAAPVYVKVFTDKREMRCGLYGLADKLLVDFDRDAVHTVKVLRISEGAVPLVFRNVRVYGKTPEFLLPPAEKPFKLEFLGDSITAGFGDMASADKNEYDTYEQDSTETYAYHTAKHLDAEIRTVCMSGQGVWHSCGDQVGVRFEEMFDMVTWGKTGYDHTLWQPDVMVLNCGTNDVPGGTTEEIMYREGGKLLDKIRRAYPNAVIIWTYGMMNGKFKKVLQKLIDDRRPNDENLYFLPVDDIYGKKNEVGAVGHPNVNASVRVSRKLAAFIRKIKES